MDCLPVPGGQKSKTKVWVVGSFSGTRGKLDFLPLVTAVLGIPWVGDVPPGLCLAQHVAFPVCVSVPLLIP